jgi:hypothetical protein
LLGALLNSFLRATIAYFLVETMVKPTDPRFVGKAISLRNLIIVGGLSLLFPMLRLSGRWRRYPFALDNLYLSIFWLDMAGNSFNLYDTHYYFDLIPHFYGSGTAVIVFKRLLHLPTLSAVGLTNMLHILLEAQEYYTDVLFGTHNVRGVSDHVNDLLAGLAGTTVYGTLLALVDRRRGKPSRWFRA